MQHGLCFSDRILILLKCAFPNFHTIIKTIRISSALNIRSLIHLILYLKLSLLEHLAEFCTMKFTNPLSYEKRSQLHPIILWNKMQNFKHLILLGLSYSSGTRVIPDWYTILQWPHNITFSGISYCKYILGTWICGGVLIYQIISKMHR